MKNKIMKLLLENCNLIGKITNILIDGEIISYIGDNPVSYNKKLNINGKIVIPGMIDPHTHIRDLEQFNKEDWVSGSTSAVAGGVTTVIDMPNTIPPTINKNNLRMKMKKAKKSLVNYGFHIGATENNITELEELLSDRDLNISGIKVFLASSSSNEIISDREKLKKIFKFGKKYNKVVIVHTELQNCINKWEDKYKDKKFNSVLYHNLIRNRECSIAGTKLALDITREIGNIIYIAHTSTKEEIEMIRKYKQDYGLKIICEATPHHLLLNESILKDVGNFGKVNPPLRTPEDNDALWQGLMDGVIDVIGSDHAPHIIEEKLRPYSNASSGFPGLETTIALFLNEINKQKRLNGKNLKLETLVKLIAKNPAKIFNIKNRGEIKTTYYADLAIIDLNKKWVIDSSCFYSKAHYSPFNNFEVQGKVIMTIVNGNIIYDNGKINTNYKGMGITL